MSREQWMIIALAGLVLYVLQNGTKKTGTTPPVTSNGNGIIPASNQITEKPKTIDINKPNVVIETRMLKKPN